MIQTGMTLYLNGKWLEEQLSLELQAIDGKHRGNCDSANLEE